MTDWRAAEIRQVPVASLVPYARNARTHSPEQVAQIAGSIREFGFTNPVLIDETGGIIAGHGRVLAAQKLGLDAVPCIVLAHLTKTQRRAYALADNKIALNSGWDDELLRLEIADLKLDGFDLDLTGFNELELGALLAETTEGETDPDDIPDPLPASVTRPGDVGLLGRHRLMCGDSTDADTVAAALNGVAPHLMVTDPPYGVEYDADWRNHAFRADGSPIIGRAIGKVMNDDRADWRAAWALFPGDVAYVWHAARHTRTVVESLEAAGFTIRSQIIWAKCRLVIGRGDYHWQHEPCFYAVRDGKTGHWQGARDQTTLWSITLGGDEDAATVHSTQKPVECMRRPIVNNSEPGDTIYEPFSGSGTTIIAAEMTGRVCLAIELSPQYVDVAVCRWEQFTGIAATLEATGKTFAEHEAERTPRT